MVQFLKPNLIIFVPSFKGTASATHGLKSLKDLFIVMGKLFVQTGKKYAV